MTIISSNLTDREFRMCHVKHDLSFNLDLIWDKETDGTCSGWIISLQ